MNRTSRFFIALDSISAYLLLLVLTYPIVGDIAGMWGTLPAVLCGWFLGMRAAVVAGMLVLPSTYVVFHWDNSPSADAFINCVVGTLGAVAVGMATARAKRLVDRTREQARQMKLERGTLQEEIAKREQAEEALQKANDNLESVVMERTAQLKETNDQLEQALTQQQALYRASEMIGKATTIEGIVRGAAELLPSLGMFSCAATVITEVDSEGTPIRGDIFAVKFKNNEFATVLPVIGRLIPNWLPGDPTYYKELRVAVFPDLKDLSTTVPHNYQGPKGALEYLQSVGIRGAVAVGLGARGRALGCLTFGCRRPLACPPEEYIRWVENIIDLVSTAVDNLQLSQQTQRELEERKQAEEQLAHSALHDPLTDLPNRTLFMDRLSRALERAKRHTDYMFAVLYLDLDRFKVVNDSLGHSVGDQLLVESAHRLAACLRTLDTVARLGGDEFVILLEEIQDVSDAIRIVDRIQHDLSLPYDLDQHKAFISVSIGVVLSAIGYDRAEDVLRDADLAMYRAKALGRARYEVFDLAMRDRAMTRLELETDLRMALERQEFFVCYQPIVSLATAKIVGFEALLRWQHPSRGLVLPGDFIPIAEETGLIVRIGDWVLREACRQMQEWQVRFPMDTPLTVSVNLSAKQFAQPDLLQKIALVLQETGLGGDSLKLELTESMVVEDAESLSAVVLQLRTLGVQVQIDDFGAGYSSLSYLHRLPIDTLKIDRTFVGKIGVNGNGTEIIRTILGLAHNLGMKVIAEGVETTDQLVKLRGLDCEYAQGYLFAKPADGKVAETLIAESLALGQSIHPLVM